jgi:hypothetical protein
MEAKRKIIGWACVLILGPLSVFFMAIHGWQRLPADVYTTEILGIMTGFFGFAALAFVVWPSLAFEASLAGPEPLKRKFDDFGPSAATAPAGHPAQDDLTYTPPSDDLGYQPTV